MPPLPFQLRLLNRLGQRLIIQFTVSDELGDYVTGALQLRQSSSNGMGHVHYFLHCFSTSASPCWTLLGPVLPA